MRFFSLFSMLMATSLAQQFTNPVLWEDLADLDIFRVGDVYYYSASTMHYSPGAPILQSRDLVNWEYVGHSVPVLNWGSKYDLASGTSAYVKGIYASTMRYRASNKLFYWYGCVEYGGTYVYTSSSVSGTWQQRAKIPQCYYDAGMLIDDNDTIYIAYGNTQISVAQLASDGLSQVRSQVVFQTPSSVGTLEGARMYKINGAYYIFLTRPANGQYVLRSTSGPFGPYTMKQLLLNLGTPISGGGVPHQGGLVNTPSNNWYYMAFVDAYPGGRIPVLAPITWGSDGFPSLTLVNGRWGVNYNYPLSQSPVKSHTGTDYFSGTSLGPEWEWNHNPDTSKFSVNNGLTLSAATITPNLYAARNTITHRILGPTSSATIVLNYGNMKDGDRAGFALLRDTSAWIGVQRNGDSFRLSFWTGLTMTSSWQTASQGSEAAGTSISGGRIYLRIHADINPGSGKQGRFYYSTTGQSFTQLGSLTLKSEWQFFMGYRYAIFNHATKSLGGSIQVSSFTVDAPGLTTQGSGVIASTTTAGVRTTTTAGQQTTAGQTTRQQTTTTQGNTSGTVPQWGQCGGQGWTGATVCVSPFKCTYSNDWYSQCL